MRSWLAWTLAAVAPAQAAEPIELYWFDRPPYMVASPGGDEVAGLTATPAAQAFRAAGIRFRWVSLPTMRQLVTLKDSVHPACAVGWLRNAEREHHFKFTQPIYRDRPTVALARTDYLPAETLAGTLRQPGTSVLIKDGFSYGAVIDQLLLQIRPERVVTSAENLAMANMIAAHRASLMFAAEEEASYLLEQAEHEARLPYPLKVVRFADLPPGERRHILCSKATPDELIERLNKAIAADAP
ncbi:substrate-binding periplasmic protein [Ideonella sp. YS5]|uniref:substrate-binding periplasmic protein n=1 Tax=Ideonella sp. YS5 TaxID=3453714 RepID=UPI003EEFF358